jgi:chromosome segregation ATPase
MKGVVFVRRLLAIMVLLTFGAFPGCGEKEQSESRPASVSKEDVKKEAKEAYAITRDYTQQQMQAFRKQMESKLNEYGDKIDQLQAKAEELGGDAKAKAEQELSALRKKRDEVSEKLKELGSSSGNAWDQIKSGIDAAPESSG